MGMVVYLFALALIGAVMPLAYDQVATLLGRLWDWWNGIGGDGQGVVIAGLLAFVGVPWTLRENARRQREMVEHAAALQREALLQKFDNERRLEGVRAAVLMREDAVASQFQISEIINHAKNLTALLGVMDPAVSLVKYSDLVQHPLWNQERREQLRLASYRFPRYKVVAINSMLLSLGGCESMLVMLDQCQSMKRERFNAHRQIITLSLNQLIESGLVARRAIAEILAQADITQD